MLKILVVEDEDDIRDLVSNLLAAAGHDVTRAENGGQALELTEAKTFDIVFSDIRLPLADGLTVFNAVKERAPDTDVVLMTTYATVVDAVKAAKAGARDYLVKPIDLDELLILVERITKERQLRHDLEKARAELEQLAKVPVIVGRSPQMVAALSRMGTIAQSHASVLINGESGTGKELTARAIHDRSPRSGKPFVVVNCAALPEGLIEAELFGSERGAFTNAEQRRTGRFEAADGGTLFFDEVAELPMSAQAKLLRVLQEGTFEPIGSDKSISVDVRVVSATHRNLKERIVQGLFREDLYYRLKVLDLLLPPLRERQGELPFLFQYFLRKFAVPVRPLPKITQQAWAAISEYPFPGNVRELSHVVERAVVLAESDEIDLQHLPAAFNRSEAKRAEPLPLGTLTEALNQFEKTCINRSLIESGGNRARAAEQLGISRKTLWEKIRAHGLTSLSQVD
ncbi:MAG: sigma-54 dependent transcriptional regulator [Deltaproteobacteria bacterium]|nr:sigma-54 dependent transcriptional regulator [Deltaproteobacteria bacterium]